MLRRIVRLIFMFILTAFTTPTLAFEECGQVYKKIQASCSTQSNQNLAKDKTQIEKSKDPATGAMALGFNQIVETAYTVCGQLLTSCRTACQAKPKELADCKESGVFGQEHAKMKATLFGGDQVIVSGGNDGGSKSSGAPKFKAGLGLPSDLGRSGVDNSITSHDYYMDELKTKGAGINLGVSIPLGGGKATSR